jgi:hypothetical protein
MCRNLVVVTGHERVLTKGLNHDTCSYMAISAKFRPTAHKHLNLGLGTVYHIDGIMVTVYSVRNRPVGVPSRFVPYTATTHILPYFTVRVTRYKTCIS